jgi:hypothetical protein
MRADSIPGRIIGALARTPEPPSRPSPEDRRDSAPWRIIGALARMPVPADTLTKTIRGADQSVHPGLPQRAPERSKSPPPSSGIPDSGDTTGGNSRTPDPYDAAEAIEMRMTAQDFIQAMDRVFEVTHAVSDRTGIIFDVAIVAEAAQVLAQEVKSARDLAKTLDEAGTGDFRRRLDRGQELDLPQVLSVARTLRRTRDNIVTLKRIIDNIGLPAFPRTAASEWNLTTFLDRLLPVADTVAALDPDSDGQGNEVPDLSRASNAAVILTDVIGQLRAVSSNAINLANELDRASRVTRALSFAQGILADVPPSILTLADRFARELSYRDISRAQQMAQSMSVLIQTLDEIHGRTSVVGTARTLQDAIQVRSVIGRLNEFETIFNYARIARTVGNRSTQDDLTRALGQINCLATAPVDASAADLRNLKFHNLDALGGVIWTMDTIWPAPIVGQVRARSIEIRPGVFQVRSGDDADPPDVAISG